jgi:hypothetical protein
MTHVENMVCNNMHLFHDNVFEYVNASQYGADHSNVVEFYGESNEANYFYNNVFRHNGLVATMGVNIWQIPTPGFTDIDFNNLVYDTVSSGNFWNTGSHSGGDGHINFFNNTIQSGSTIACGTSLEMNCSIAQNNHFIGAGSPFQYPPTTETADLLQTSAQATAAGYTAGNQYSPQSAGAPTVGAGTAWSAICTGISDANAASACMKSTTLSCSYTGAGNLTCPGQTVVSRSLSAWDIGAYAGAGTSNAGVQPPTGLTAVVQAP